MDNRLYLAHSNRSEVVGISSNEFQNKLISLNLEDHHL